MVQQLQRFLKALFIPESFNSLILIELLEKIRQLNSVKPELNGSAISKNVEFTEKVMLAASTASLQKTGIAVLLLDAENLQLNTETEQFLTTVCTCPIQVKIAFANWRSMGKLDKEL